MNNVLEGAFAQTLPAFNAHAITRSLASPETLGHMWEFGTRGITRGNSKFTPMNPKARLWETVMTGTGVNKTIGFTFKPATSFNPPQTEEETGVAQSVLDRLKSNTGEYKYRFPNKAFVYESGTDVKIFPQRAKLLFIPTKTEGLPTGSYSRRWGYAWAKSHTYSPGDFAGATGAFTGMFGAYWAGKGATAMFDFMADRVETDLIEVDGTIRSGKRMTPVQTQNLQAAVKRGETKTRKQFILKTRREAGVRAEGIL